MLKCKVNTKEFEGALKKLNVIRPNKSSLKVLENIKIETKEDHLLLTSTDLENTLEVKINDFEVEVYGVAIITNVKNIMKSFRYFKEYETIIEAKEGNIKISNGKKEIKNITVDAEEYPCVKVLNNITEQKTYTYNSKDLYNRLNKVIAATSKDQTRPILTGIHFNNNDIVGIDGFKLFLNKDDTLTVNKPFTINQTNSKALLKLLNKKDNDLIEIVHDDKNIKFIFDNMILTSKLLEGEYIKYKNIISTDYNTTVEVEKEDIKSNLEFLSLYTKDTKNQLIKLDVKKENIEISANNNTGLYKVENEILNYRGDNVEIGINNKYMIETLKVIDNDKFNINLNSSVSPMTLTANDEKELYLIMPIRLVS